MKHRVTYSFESIMHPKRVNDMAGATDLVLELQRIFETKKLHVLVESGVEEGLSAEDLIDDYINGNLGKVQERLEQAPPMTAAIVAVDLYRMIMVAGTPENPSAALFLKRLRAWQ